MADREPDSARDESRQLWRLAGMGWTLASEILAGTLIGWAVDRFSGTTGPWGTVCGTVVGVIVGMTTFLRGALKANREAMEQARARRQATGPADPSSPDES